eukprot:TRINITY_DN4428_c0_g1_i2.p1 TRINITY_DN4428_c0_g1~~TRINITY_DN4428_c0_g1_i2.p1  ORF type:complete len:362 (+),score=44.35 TRINITY_DN4428_c0_g1_i2:204-1289(+)
MWHEERETRAYGALRTPLCCPSLAYCQYWREWEQMESKRQQQKKHTAVSSVLLKRLMPAFFNPFAFKPGAYRYFRPYHSDAGHTTLTNAKNYVRAAHCFFVERYWFWFYFTPSNEEQPVQILSLLAGLFFPLTLIPIFMLLAFVLMGNLPLRLFCYSFPWYAPEVSWPIPLLVATVQGIAGPLFTFNTLVFLHRNPYEYSPGHKLLQNFMLVLTGFHMQFILSTWGPSLVTFCVQTIQLAIGLTITRLVNAHMGSIPSLRPLYAVLFLAIWLYLLDLGLAFVLTLTLLLPVYFALLPQKQLAACHAAANSGVLSLLDQMTLYNVMCSAPTLYLATTVLPSYLVIVYYGFSGLPPAPSTGLS